MEDTITAGSAYTRLIKRINYLEIQLSDYKHAAALSKKIS